MNGYIVFSLIAFTFIAIMSAIQIMFLLNRLSELKKNRQERQKRYKIMGL